MRTAASVPSSLGTNAVPRLPIAGAAAEIARWNDYDYVLVIADVERCLADIRSILAAERLRRIRQKGLSSLVESLLREL